MELEYIAQPARPWAAHIAAIGEQRFPVGDLGPKRSRAVGGDGAEIGHLWVAQFSLPVVGTLS